WFEINYAPKNNIEYPFKIINNSTQLKVWKTKTGQKIESEHPPLRELNVNHFNKTITILSYKTKNKTEDITFKDVKNIIKQNNYTNTVTTRFSDRDGTRMWVGLRPPTPVVSPTKFTIS